MLVRSRTFYLALYAAALFTALCATTALPAETGFVPLFDGKSLAGWELFGGTGGGYVVDNGELRVPPGGGGNLLTEKEYADFVLRFEFLLEDGSNNGLCIRCPAGEGSMAYEGMELQIIDNTSERYADIEPWQKHGSLYHVFPAKTGALRPTGKWNEEEVTVIGRTVTVTLNGEVILDVNLDDVTDPEILEKHPGLQRESGRIGFLGHNEPVRFRNIRIQER